MRGCFVLANVRLALLHGRLLWLQSSLRGRPKGQSTVSHNDSLCDRTESPMEDSKIIPEAWKMVGPGRHWISCYFRPRWQVTPASGELVTKWAEAPLKPSPGCPLCWAAPIYITHICIRIYMHMSVYIYIYVMHIYHICFARCSMFSYSLVYFESRKREGDVETTG